MSKNQHVRKKQRESEDQTFMKFQEKIGIFFSDISLLKQAFTHSSYVNEQRKGNDEDNERLEFSWRCRFGTCGIAFSFHELSAHGRRRDDQAPGGYRL